jgi:hypothetical protein
MIRYALACSGCTHEFDAWFASSADYDRLAAGGLNQCPACQSPNVVKQIMAPAVRTAEQKEAAAAKAALEESVQAHISENFDYVGEEFADEARSMFYGEAPHRPIWGETSPEDREALSEEGIPALPLPPGLAPKKAKRTRPPRKAN